MFWARPRLGQVCATRWLEPCGGSVGMTPGYPGHDLCKYVGDAVRGTRGISVSLGMSSSLLAGASSKDPVGRVPGVLGGGLAPCVGNVLDIPNETDIPRV